MKNKILFICKKRIDSYGNSFGLINSAKFVANYLNETKFEAKVITAVDANEIDKLVTQENPHVVIIEALWVPANKFKELLSIKRHQHRKWIIRLHSKTPFLANEGMAFSWLNEYNKIKELIIAPNNYELTDDLRDVLGLNVVYLPNIYEPEDYNCKCRLKKPHGINIGCFGAIRPMKNHLMQAIAAIKFANSINEKLNFHINSGRLEQQGDQVLKNLRALFEGTKHNLVEHPWMNHKEFIRVVKIMDIGMQVSLSETFNIVAADFVHNDIAFVGSKEIEWMSSMFQADPNNVQNIVETLDRAYHSSLMLYLNKFGLWNHNRKAKNIWNEYFENLGNCKASN